MALSALFLTLASVGCWSGNGPSVEALGAPALAELPWDSVLTLARGTDVTWRMWRGDPAINDFVDGWVAPRLAERFGVRLKAVDGRGPELVNQLGLERDTRARGGADLVWINGETFQNLRDEALLQGPWAGALPSARWVDSTSAIIMRDFEQPLAGLEAPWGQVHFALIYDSERTPNPPHTVEELGVWIRTHPGRFTHDQSFTGITFHKVLMYALAGGVERFQGGFREEDYSAGRDALLEWLRAHRGAFWRGGAVYPADVADVHRLFANGEVDFTMSYNQSEAITKARQGVFPESARPLLLRDGTIANAHYVGIPFNAPNPAGAMVVADLLLSPEAQLEKLRPGVWGDGTVLAIERLPESWRVQFEEATAVPGALATDLLRRHALPEVAPEYHERWIRDWRSRIRREGG